MNDNFKIILKNNKKLIVEINDSFNSAYIKMARKKYDAEELKNHKDLEGVGFCLKHIIRCKNGNVKEASIVFEKVNNTLFLHFKDEDLNTWFFEIKKNKNDRYDLKLNEVDIYLKGVPIRFILNIKKESSKIKCYKGKTSIGEVELTKSEIDQDLVDLTFITTDLDISFFKNMKVKDIIYDSVIPQETQAPENKKRIYK